ncbi:MAG TPA: two-component regulator propeller domain-containing protein [Chitinophagaceae bacterium]|nr:two-component regulator propeller domain-containing protein [Chitinophagaceae bacterium]
MRFTLTLLILFSFIINCKAQPAGYTAFTVNDGLPGNHIYRCVEDNKGFLWVATDEGIARFDGRHFQIFTTQQGLPDNEVLAVVKEKNGRIWVNCFKQSPAYFDEVQNSFINAKKDSNLAKVSGTKAMYVSALQNGGVIYYNENGFYIFRDKKLVELKNERDILFLIKENDDGSQLRLGRIFYPALKKYHSKIYHLQKNKIIDSLTTNMNAINWIPALDDGKFYSFNRDEKKCYIYSNFYTHPIRFKLDSISIPEPFYNFSFTNTSLYLIGFSGKIYVIDKKTLQQQYIISGNYLPNSFYNDSKGNIWVSTVDKGLIVYRKKHFPNFEMPAGYTRTNFLSLARKQDGTLLAGNYYGEVMEADEKKFTVNTIFKKIPSRQRKILIAGNNVFTFSEDGITVNFSKPLINPANKKPYAAKTAIIYNDSIIITGLFSGVMKLNTITQKITLLNPFTKRVTALVKANDGMIYFGSTDGLYKYNYSLNTVVSLAKNNPLFGERITALSASPDNLLWIATPGNGIVVVKDDKVLLNITASDGIINNSCRSITSGKPGQVWLGTAQGISIINYELRNSRIRFSIQNLSVNDGLTNNEVNEMLYQNDIVYAATADGISVIPADISIPKFDIPVQIIGISINQRDTIIAKKYNLDYDQQSIRIGFAGIELSGHFKNLQYTLDKNKNWINLNENTLALQLNNGNHTLQVRAVDVNGNISDKILTMQFSIATPFWKAAWFWITLAIVLQFLTIYMVIRWQKERKKTRLAKDLAMVQNASLEQQAFTSLLNPHFMFNALNSIQHYINVQDRQNANRYLSDFASLIRKNFEAAQQSFIPLEQELENIKIYLRLEQMRFTNRFTYKIYIDDSVDTDNWMIPTMMMQPLLENALLHGIMPSTINGELIIDLKEFDTSLLITITDNGIGIENNRALKQHDQHKSRGMELITKRIAALSHFVTQPITINMAPAFKNDKNPGNKITLLIPAELYKAWLHAQKIQ